MKVTLNIENDAELRAYIKDCIKNQAMAVVREELVVAIREEIDRKVKGFQDRYNFDRLVSEATTEAVKTILKEQYGVTYWSQEFIKPFVDAKVAESVQRVDWDEIVNELAKRKVQALIK